MESQNLSMQNLSRESALGENSDPEGSPAAIAEQTTASKITPAAEPAVSAAPKPSYVKLAMRNMVRKRGQSLWHFFLTATGLLGLLVGLSYLTR